MAQQTVHFEIFTRKGARGGWKLHDAVTERDGALKLAQALMAEGKATGVKVVKETYNAETGDYLTLKIFEEGHNRARTDPAAEDVPNTLPCFKPDDLYSYHARATMARLISDYLARQKLTVTEFIHRADALEKFEATGTLYQHAIQKIAVAQAASTKKPVQQIIKEMYALASKAIGRVYRDQRRRYFPDVEAGGFRALAEKLAGEGDGAYVLNGAIARHLSAAKGWEEKLVCLLSIMEESTDETPGGKLLLSAVDGIAAEILNGSAALQELIGPHRNLGDALTTLIHIFLGEAREGAPARDGIAVLTKHFAADDLPNARTAIANRIMAELKSFKRLQEGTLLEEIAILKRIANKLVLGQGKYLSNEDLIAAFTLRSKRLVAHESLARFLDTIAGPDERLEKLLLIEESIIGVKNKRELASVMLTVVSSQAFGTHFQSGTVPVLTQLKRLAELQARVLRSGLQDHLSRDIAVALDKTASGIEARAKVLDAIAARAASPADKVLAVLKLYNGGILTEGRLSAKAREFVIAELAMPGFLASYAAHLAGRGETPTPQTARSELVQILEKAGITPETGLRTIAA